MREEEEVCYKINLGRQNDFLSLIGSVWLAVPTLFPTFVEGVFISKGEYILRKVSSPMRLTFELH